MEHANDWCFRDIYKAGLWEDDLYISVLKAQTCKSLKPIALHVLMKHCYFVLNKPLRHSLMLFEWTPKSSET